MSAIGEELQSEITKARHELEAAEHAFDYAEPAFVDSANYKVLACQSRLNALYQLARECDAS